jgi:hypothetical protein
VGSYGGCGLFHAQCSVLDFIGQTISNVDGAAGQQTASSTLDAGDPNGSAQSMVTASGGLFIPDLHAAAFSNAGGGTTAFAFAAQAYQIDDPAATGTIEVLVTLNGSILDSFDFTPGDPDPLDPFLPPEEVPSPDLTQIEVVAGLVATTGGFSLLDIPADAGGAFAQLETYVQHDTLMLAGEDTNVGDGLATLINESGILSVSGLALDSEVILYAAILASSDGEESPGVMNFSDAFSTVSMSFTANSDQVALATVVPVPPAMWLFGSSLAGLLLLRRRALV